MTKRASDRRGRSDRRVKEMESRLYGRGVFEVILSSWNPIAKLFTSSSIQNEVDMKRFGLENTEFRVINGQE